LVLASFVRSSGLDVIKHHVFDAVANRATIRILVSDYLFISDVQALRRLLSWTQTVESDPQLPGRLLARVIETQKLTSRPDSFHPKSWRIVDEHGGFIAVGSSNISKPALETGIEWNLLSTSRTTTGAHAEFAAEFDQLWQVATELTQDFVARYSEHMREYRSQHFEPESVESQEVPKPRPWQLTALESLQRIRAAGYRRALVAGATGMGKTWLAAFDARQVGIQLGRRPRVLVIAHRSQILAQTEAALSLIMDSEFGMGQSAWYIGDRSDLDGDIVVASIQKLSRCEGLERLAAEQFDYAIIDEVHHAHAPTYRRALAKIDSSFVLGLTATPERADGVDVASIFDDNLAHHATIGDGIVEESLVPFHYVGIKDTIDFRQVPWRNGRFDLDELEKRVEKSERMERLWQAMKEYPAERTIVFCCSQRHALFARDWLRARKISAAAVFSGGNGDSCGESLESLRTGKLQALCVVDMFNEGLDIPAVDRIIMLRPTESKVVFLQQLGRGLRASVGKARLLVIDFVGNHRIFGQRLIHLLSLQSKEATWEDLKKWLDGQEVELPPGCLLDVELAARDVLKEFLPRGAEAALEAYRAMRDELGRRPTASELVYRNILPKTLSNRDGSWFEFVASEGDLDAAEQHCLGSFKTWFKTLETTNLNKSYKMVVLRVLLDNDALFAPVDLNEFSQQCRDFMRNHPVLRRDLQGDGHALNHEIADEEEWTAWWVKWPIDRWLDQQHGQRWFKRIDNEFQLAVDCPDELKATFVTLSEELVDWRLAAYSKAHRLDHVETGDTIFEAKVSHGGGRPILFIPDKMTYPNRPVGPTTVALPNGDQWEFKFVKVACNVAKPLGTQENGLGELLKSWFGPTAGQPGTDYKVVFSLSDGRWSAKPQNANRPEGSSLSSKPRDLAVDRKLSAVLEKDPDSEIVHDIPATARYTTHLPVYDLIAAAGGFGDEGVPEEIGWTRGC
jgi:superfamily II DNA or RNA helicase